jgi:hypothetical protein
MCIYYYFSLDFLALNDIFIGIQIFCEFNLI